MSDDPGCCYEFDTFRIDPVKRLLRAGGEVIPLRPKAFALLLFLVRNSHRVVTKGELLNALWPDTAVAESNIMQNIFLLRKALGEGVDEHRYLVTVPGCGYRFVARVREVAAGDAGDSGADRVEAAASCRSIAVLPFECLNGDPADEYLGHGIAETLSGRLASIGRLTVRPAAGAALKHGGFEHDPVRAGRRLGVTLVVCGTFQRFGERVRINTRIVSVRDRSLDWTSRLDASLTDIFAVQDAIAEQVADAVSLKLTGEEGSRLRRRRTESTEAHLNYLRGRYFLSRRTLEALRKAAGYFEQAIGQDPRYALAYAGLADCYNVLACYSMVRPSESWPKAKAAAKRALEIDDQLAEAHTALGLALMGSEWAWTEAGRQFQRALALNPDYAFGVGSYAEYCSALGRHDEAVAAIRRAQELEPLSLLINCDVGWYLFLARRYEEAAEQLHHALEMDPHCAMTHWTLAWCYAIRGRGREARAEFEEASRLFEKGTLMLASMGHAGAAAGDRGMASEALQKLVAASGSAYVSPYNLALLHIALGDSCAALHSLERACDDRPFLLVHLGSDPRLDPLRSDARFNKLLERIGLVPG